MTQNKTFHKNPPVKTLYKQWLHLASSYKDIGICTYIYIHIYIYIYVCVCMVWLMNIRNEQEYLYR